MVLAKYNKDKAQQNEKAANLRTDESVMNMMKREYLACKIIKKSSLNQ